jgi:diguanylate cyclase (GGDEF)-like protein/PAS domain S-box-containing protein
MTDYTKMNKADLIKMLKALEATTAGRPMIDQLQRVVNELQVHQVEIEIQNRELRETQQQLEQSRDRYADLYDFSPVGYVTLNEKGVIKELNLAATSILGAARVENIGMPFLMYVEKSDTKKFQSYLRRCRGAQTSIAAELRLMPRSGVPLDMELHTVPVRDPESGQVLYRVALVNVSQRKQAIEELRLMRTVFHRCGEAVAICDNRNYILSVNPSFHEITGYAEDDALGKHARLIDARIDHEKPYDAWWTDVVNAGGWEGEVRGRHKDGTYYPQWLRISSVRNEHGYTTHYIHIFSDLARPGEHSHEHAHYDVLTGLPNRTLLHDRLALTLSGAQRNDTAVAVLCLGVDRFKLINEIHGLPAGDALLKLIASRLSACSRAEDTICRYGNDEFIVVLADMRSTPKLVQTVEKIIRTVGQPFTLNEIKIEITISSGISVYPQDGQDPQTLIKNSRSAMQHAKDNTRNTYQFFTKSFGHDAAQRLALERKLQRAIERNEFTMDYQPQMASTRNQIIGCEALIRWRDPEQGVVLPEHFIPVAEECGLIEAIGEWSLRKTCAQLRSWQDAGLMPVPVAVNISDSQFRRQDFIQMVDGLLRQYRITPGYLALELTERALSGNADLVTDHLRKLKALGLQIVLDRFGSDYSSLAYVKRMPINKLKIDKSVIRELPNGKQDRTLVRTIVDIGYNFGFTIVATGVETRAQYDCLSLEGCQSMQGHYFGTPMGAGEFTELLRTGNTAEAPN